MEWKDIGVAIVAIIVGAAPYILKLLPTKAHKLKNSELKSHPFFTRMRYHLQITIPNIKIENSKKKKMIITFLKIKFETWYDAYYADIINNSNKFNRREDRVPLCLYCVKQYEEKIREKGIPEIFIRKFSEWHKHHVDIAVDGIENIWQNDFYSSIEEKKAAELDLLLAAFAYTIVDVQKTLNDFNGELDEILEKTDCI